MYLKSYIKSFTEIPGPGQYSPDSPTIQAKAEKTQIYQKLKPPPKHLSYALKERNAFKISGNKFGNPVGPGSYEVLQKPSNKPVFGSLYKAPFSTTEQRFYGYLGSSINKPLNSNSTLLLNTKKKNITVEDISVQENKEENKKEAGIEIQHGLIKHLSKIKGIFHSNIILL